MRKLKSLFLVWRPNIVLILIVLCSGCVGNMNPELSVRQEQKALDLIDQGTLLLRSNRLDEAQGAFAAAADIAPIAAALDGLGCVAFMRKDFLMAEKYFVAAYKADSHYNTSLGNLALLYEINGLQEKAQQLYSMALGYEPENFRTRNNFAGLLLDNNDRGRAKLELLKALALAKHPVVASNLTRLEEYE